MRHHLISALLCCGTLLSVSTARAADNAADAADAAKAYIGRLRTGEVRQAVIDCWQTDALLSASFGLMYLDLPEGERKRAQSAFTEFLTAPFSSSRVAQLFKSIEVQEAAPTQIDASTVSVRMQLVGDAGKFRSVNTLLLVKTSGGWRITDQRQGDQQSIRTALVMTYVGMAKGPADTIPVVLERAAAETRREMLTR